MSCPPKILIAIDVSDKKPYRDIFEQGPLKTWIDNRNLGVFPLAYLSQKPSFFIKNLNTLIEYLRWQAGKYPSYLVSYALMWILKPWKRYIPKTTVEERLSRVWKLPVLRIRLLEAIFTQRWKKLAVIEYFLSNGSFDFLLFITPSCYIQESILLDHARDWPKDRSFYAGTVLSAADSDFVSGGTLVLNQISARQLIEARHKIPLHTVDDVSMGVAMTKLGIMPESLEGFINISNLQELDNIDTKKFFYIRMKSGTLKKRNDVQLFSKLHKMLLNEMGSSE